MGRLRIDAYGTTQLKQRISSSHRELNGQSQVHESGLGGGGGSRSLSHSAGIDRAGASGSTQKLSISDALSYLKEEVKDVFQSQREKYDLFFDVMKDFNAQRIDTAGVIARVKVLFKGHPRLILGFNSFLPKGYQTILNNDNKAPPRKTIEFDEAISFVNKVRKRFQNNDHVYKSFLDILNIYRKEHKGINEVYHEVSILFNDHPDLMDEFTRYLPNSAIANPFPLDRIIGPLRDLDLDDDKTMIKLHKEQKRRAGKDSRDERTHDQDYKEPANENEGDLSMQCLTDKMKSVLKVEEFGGPHEDKNDLMKYTYSQGFAFCERVKERLRSPTDYQTFLTCLRIYSREIITREQLQSLVANVLGKHPGLMEDFNEFIERYERVVGFLANVMSQRKSDEGHTSKLVKGEEKEYKEHRCKTEAPPTYQIKEENEVPLEEAISFVRKVKVAILLNDHPDLLDEFTKFLPDSSALSVFKHYFDRSIILFTS
ncbi:paired amphipathic helix protein Sin3-like 2 [Lycium ferocissimum]|uniref:paired amphipathic helix protein Sin3-like 2 n=1 Tax=Lycium ferocissimum TaxID=112874 RepID=UPI0028167737|nr:paired amphipathic helix protein Sin3-like 2 [Lycium ferocissimum]